MRRDDVYLAVMYGCGVLALWVIARLIRYDDDDN